MSDKKNELAHAPPADSMWQAEGFEHMQRVAKAYASSDLVPAHMRGNVANVMAALSMARRTGQEPLMVLQNMHSIKGKSGWNATYIIAQANRSGIFRGRINWRIEGKGEGLEVTAYAKLADTGDEVSFTVSFAMAKADGWTRNPKYKSMPELMLRYRSAVILVRLYAPEVLLGLPVLDEIEDVTYATNEAARPTGLAALGLDAQIVEAETIEEGQ